MRTWASEGNGDCGFCGQRCRWDLEGVLLWPEVGGENSGWGQRILRQLAFSGWLFLLGHVQDLLPKNRVWKKEEAALESGET